MTDNLRDKLEEVCCQYNSQFAETEKFADAILALLRERITLEWELVKEHPHHYHSTCGNYIVYDSGHDGIAWGFKSDAPGGFTYEYHYQYGPYAFDAALEHHRKTVMLEIGG